MVVELVDTLFSPRLAQTPSPVDDFWYESAGRYSGSGAYVTPETAMRISAVFACVRVLAETVHEVPLIVYRRLPNGDRERAPEHPLYKLLHDDPNDDQTSGEFREMLTGHTALRGTSFARIIGYREGRVEALEPIHPDAIKMERLPSGIWRWKLRRDNGTTENLNAQEVFRLPGLSSNGITGLSVLELARESFGLSIALESYGSRSFNNGVRPSGVLSMPGALRDENKLNRLRKQWEDTYSGTQNAGKTVILEDGMTWAQVGMKNSDAEFLASRSFQIKDIARWFRMPLHLIQDLDRATFSNIEHQSLEFVMFTMLPWFVRWEQRARKQLFIGEGYYAEHLVTTLLRGDTKTRYEAYQLAIQNGIMNRNEVRRLENMNAGPPELDEFLQPKNIGVAGEEPPPASPPAPGRRGAHDPRGRAFAGVLAGQMVRKELAAVQRAAKRYAGDGEGWEAWARDFYGEFSAEISERCYVAPEDADRFAVGSMNQLLAGGVAAFESAAEEHTEQLMRLMLEEQT